MFDSQCQATRQALREQYAVAILQDISKIELDAKCWKLLHYKLIQDFRNRIKLIKLNIKNSRDDLNTYKSLSASFRYFLTDATGFYINLMNKLIIKYNTSLLYITRPLEFANIDHESVSSETEKLMCMQMIHRILIYLGDLARYREAYSEKKIRTYRLAQQMYFKAMRLIPEYGNPYNQLAVIYMYIGDEVGALEMYLRSLTVQQAWPSAMSNINVLFEKSRESKTGFIYLHSLLFDENFSAVDFKDRASENIKLIASGLSGSFDNYFSPNIYSKLITITISTLYLLKQKNSISAVESGLLFLVDVYCCILSHVENLLKRQLQDGVIYVESVHYEKVLQFAEPFLPTLKIILMSLTAEFFESGNLNTTNLIELVATICNHLNRFYQLFPVTNQELCCFPEDSALFGFLPVDFTILKTSSQQSLSIDDPFQVTGRIDQIMKISKELIRMRILHLDENSNFTSHPIEAEKDSNVEFLLSTVKYAVKDEPTNIWAYENTISPGFAIAPDLQFDTSAPSDILDMQAYNHVDTISFLGLSKDDTNESLSPAKGSLSFKDGFSLGNSPFRSQSSTDVLFENLISLPDSSNRVAIGRSFEELWPKDSKSLSWLTIPMSDEEPGESERINDTPQT